MTQLLYLLDTYQWTCEALVIDIKNSEEGIAIILDQTIFYPQGGGQPSDHGIIYTENSEFKVHNVHLSPEGVVYHYGTYSFGSIDKKEKVKLHIDEERRKIHAKLHSAGHLIDIAAKNIGITLEATKGYHFPDGPYVEYEGVLEEPSIYIGDLEKEANKLIQKSILIEKHKLTPKEAQEQNIWAPPGKSARVINFKGYKGCGCGGTHVNNTNEIEHIHIRKISSKKGKTKIAYQVTPGK